jgi:Mn2+/Fe2+ NRAMP family transporter
VSARSRLIALVAVLGPGLLAGLSDDDPAGITTYSILGAEYGYQLLWVLLLSTVALILFHEVGSRVGVVSGQGLTGLVRERYGIRVAAGAVLALLVANVGTTCAELAGVAASAELAGIARVISVPLAAVGVTLLVLRGSFHRIEHVLLALSSVLLAYVITGLIAGPDWSAAARGLLVPSMPFDRAAVLAVTATVGTTLAPWGLSFLQSYAADKRLTPDDLRYERVDVIVGAVLTGVIGAFVIIACAETLHPAGRSIDDARDAAAALEPLAGSLSATLFGAGLLGAAILAAAVVPLATAYSVSEVLGVESALDDPVGEAPVFYGTYIAVMVVSAVVVLVPDAPLVRILYLTQALNAVLLLPILVLLYGIVRDEEILGEHASGRRGTVAYLVVIGLLAVCVATLAVLSLV